MKYRVMLIGCAKTKKKDLFGENIEPKAGVKVIPETLYGGQLFSKRVAYANERNIPWYVLSAKYGVWHPRTLMKPYDQSFDSMTIHDRVMWHSAVCNRLANEMWEPFDNKKADGPIDPRDVTFEFHAGADYCHPLSEMLKALGFQVELPLSGLGIGQQLAWYSSGVLV